MPPKKEETAILSQIAAQYQLLQGVREKRAQLAAGDTLDASVPASPEAERLILVSRRLPYQVRAVCMLA